MIVPWIMTTADQYLECLPEVLDAFHSVINDRLTLLCFEKPTVPNWVDVISLGNQVDFGVAFAEPMIPYFDEFRDPYFHLLLGDYKITHMHWGRLASTWGVAASHGINPAKLDMSLDTARHPHSKLGDGVILKHQTTPYRASLQPAMWKTSYFKSLLKPQQSVHMFELHGSELAMRDGHDIVANEGVILSIDNLVQHGEIRNGPLEIGKGLPLWEK